MAAITIRGIDDKFWTRLKIQAARDGITLKNLTLKSYAEYLAKREGKSK